jgi:hypothetical protein
MSFKNKVRLGFILGIVIIIQSCKPKINPYKFTDHKKYQVYAQKMDTVITHPGVARAELDIPKANDPLVKWTVVYWNLGHDSLSVQYPENKDTLRIFVDSLNKLFYTFKLYNFYENFTNKSLPYQVSVKIYGKNNVNLLSNRIIKTIALKPEGNTILLRWQEVEDSTLLGSVVKYTNTANKSDSIFVPVDSTQTTITNYKGNSIIKYNSLYSLGIDTVSTAFQTRTIDEIKLKNSGPPIKHALWDGSRWGDPKYWKVNDAIKTRSGPDGTMVGGFDGYKGIGHLGAERWYSSDGIVTDGKIYQTVTLPAGTYSFNAYFNPSLEGEVTRGFDPKAEYYLVVTKEDTLPDIQDIKSGSMAYTFLTAPVTKTQFTLDKRTKITLGFVATLEGQKENFKCTKLRLMFKK